MHITTLRALLSAAGVSRMLFSFNAEAGQLDELPDGRAVSF